MRWKPGVLGLLVGTCAVAATLSGCSPTSGAEGRRAPEQLLRVDFDEAEPTHIGNAGTAAAEIVLLAVNKPTTRFENGPEGTPALRLPRYSGRPGGSYAAVTIRPQATDWLSPGAADFGFGADITLDADSSGTAVDNGDNVLQRGLFGDPAQYKLQVDKRRPSCVVRGTEGTVEAKSRVALEVGVWYRLGCRRAGTAVHLTVQRLSPAAEPAPAVETTAEGPTGDVTMDLATPLSIGAKVSATGQLTTSSTDQFNGSLDNVYFSRVPGGG